VSGRLVLVLIGHVLVLEKAQECTWYLDIEKFRLWLRGNRIMKSESTENLIAGFRFRYARNAAFVVCPEERAATDAYSYRTD